MLERVYVNDQCTRIDLAVLLGPEILQDTQESILKTRQLLMICAFFARKQRRSQIHRTRGRRRREYERVKAIALLPRWGGGYNIRRAWILGYQI